MENFMKKIIVSLLFLVPILTGCANIDTKITINNDKSASVATSISYKGDLSNENDSTANLIHENYAKYIDSSYNIDKAFNSKLSTIIADKKVDDVSKQDLDLSTLGFVSNLPSGKFIELKKSFLVKSYNIDCTFDYPAEVTKYSKKSDDKSDVVQKNDTDKKGLTPEYYQQYMDKDDTATSDNDLADNLDDTVKQPADDEDNISDNTEANGTREEIVVEDTKKPEPLNLSVTVQVPALAFYNNADSSKGNQYTWNIKQDEPTVIKIQYVQYSGWAITFFILAGVVILILGARKIIKHENQKRVGNNENLVK